MRFIAGYGRVGKDKERLKGNWVKRKRVADILHIVVGLV